jgi:hypothetical protein
MNQKSIAIASILSATIFTAVFTTTLPFSMKSAEGQLPPPTIRCPVGYERDSSGVCVPITRPPPDTTESRTEQNIICSGFSYTCG